MDGGEGQKKHRATRKRDRMEFHRWGEGAQLIGTTLCSCDQVATTKEPGPTPKRRTFKHGPEGTQKGLKTR